MKTQRTREEIEEEIVKMEGQKRSFEVISCGHAMLQTEILLDIRDLLQAKNKDL